MRASDALNLLDARQAISVTERQRYILRVRELAKGCAEAYYAAREALGFPLANPNSLAMQQAQKKAQARDAKARKQANKTSTKETK